MMARRTHMRRGLCVGDGTCESVQPGPGSYTWARCAFGSNGCEWSSVDKLCTAAGKSPNSSSRATRKRPWRYRCARHLSR
jgi:hypothetical protein